jgi:sugar phosphate isomerase/epimerase
MNQSTTKDLSRRTLLQSAAVAAVFAATSRGADEPPPSAAASSSNSPKSDVYHGLKIGVASYSLRGLKLDDAIAGIVRVGLKYCSIKDIHLPMKSTAAERKAIAAKFKDAGITPLSVGTVGMENDEAGIRRAFEYARDIGVPTIVCNPHPGSFAILDRMVKEFRDIKLAIHNHGPASDRFKSPYDSMKAAEKYDERIGVCVDVGHTAECGVDPAEAIRKCAPRLYDVHLKDIVERADKAPVIEVGRGILDVPAILKALIDVKFSGHAGNEYEKDAKDPLPGLAESVGFIRGVMKMM